MLYQFDITLSEADYLTFNKFHALRSHYSKKTKRFFRWMIAVFFTPFILLSLFLCLASPKYSLAVILFILATVLFELLLKPYLLLTIHLSLAMQKTQGKMNFSPRATMEFFEDRLVEITETEKTERTYASIERVSIIEGQTIYLHASPAIAYIMPLSCFSSQQQYEEFAAFIKSKCASVDTYPAKSSFGRRTP